MCWRLCVVSSVLVDSFWMLRVMSSAKDDDRSGRDWHCSYIV